MIRIVGFCDVENKPRGMEWNVLFRESDCFDAEEPPGAESLREYASERGYFPSGLRGARPDMCDPVYRYRPGHLHRHAIEYWPEGRR
jgi:hypothetical protein